MRPLQTDAEIANSVYGKLTVIWRHGKRFGATTWFCWCECGLALITPLYPLRNGRTISCGCVSREKTAKIKLTHGKTETREYVIWCNMKARCSNPKVRIFPHYGGRGIKVCQAWIDSFEQFITDVGMPPNDGKRYSIDRIDTNGHYEPGNVRWATQEEQMNNTRCNRKITAFGRTQTLMQWSKETGLNHKTISRRLDLGWGAERALSEKPKLGPRPKKT